jgi:ribosomal protein L37AE/L43A
MAKQESITLPEFQKRYGDGNACREHLSAIRRPHGFICPKCGHTEYYFHTNRELYQCRHCRRQVSITAGTVMHGTHTPLVKWFWAVYPASRDKRGIPALRLKGELDVCCTAAWTMLHKIRKATGERDAKYRLAGLAEADGSYFGGPKIGGKRGRGTEKRQVIAGVPLNAKKQPCLVKMAARENVKHETLAAFAQAHIEEGAVISSDAYTAYLKAFSSSKHPHEPKRFTKADKDHLKWLHVFVSNAKTFILGTCHGLGDQHFQAYLDEFCYRANRRGFTGELFNRLLFACASAFTITYKSLTACLADASG